MTPREALVKLRGTLEDKNVLFDYFIEKTQTASLEDWEIAMLETLRNDFKPKTAVIEMSASLKGEGMASS